jgi:hypothetical protein
MQPSFVSKDPDGRGCGNTSLRLTPLISLYHLLAGLQYQTRLLTIDIKYFQNQARMTLQIKAFAN